MWSEHLLVITNIDVELVAQCANSLRFGDFISSVQEHVFVVQCFCIIFTLCLVWCINSDYLWPTLTTSKTFLFLPFSKCSCELNMTWETLFLVLGGRFLLSALLSAPSMTMACCSGDSLVTSSCYLFPLSWSCSSEVRSRLTLQPSVALCGCHVTLSNTPCWNSRGLSACGCCPGSVSFILWPKFLGAVWIWKEALLFSGSVNISFLINWTPF